MPVLTVACPSEDPVLVVNVRAGVFVKELSKDDPRGRATFDAVFDAAEPRYLDPAE
jgi:hypothetical protein